MSAETLLRRVSWYCAVATGTLGALTLTGWLVHLPGLQAIFPGTHPPSPNTSLCFLLSGLALWLHLRVNQRWSVPAARVLAAFVFLRAGTLLLTEALGHDFGSGFLNSPLPTMLPQTGSRIPIGTTLPFALAALGMLVLGQQRRLHLFLSNWFGLAVLLYVLLIVTGNLLTGNGSTFPIAAASQVGFLLLGTGLLCARFDGSLLRLFLPRHPLHAIAQRLAVFGLTIPLIIYSLCVLLVLPLIPAYHDVLILVVVIATFLLLGALVASLQRMEEIDRKLHEAEGSRDVLLARLQNQAANLEVQVAERTRELQQTSERLQLALHSSKYGVWDWDLTRGTNYWDDTLCAIYGLKPGGYDGRNDSFINMVHPDDRGRVRELMQEHVARSTGFSDEFRIVWADGSIHHVFSRGSIHRDAAGQVTRMTGLNRDVTVERERDQAVAALSERLLFVLNATGYGVWEYDFVTDRMEWDDHLLEIYGLRRDQITGQTKDWHDCVQPEDLPGVVAEIDRVVSGDRVHLQQQFRIIRPDGSVRYISSHGYILRDAGSQPRSMVGFDQDITAENALREELRITEERWQLALTGNNDGVWDWNVATGEIYRDGRSAEIVGAAAGEIAADRQIWQTLGHPEDVPGANLAMADHLEGRKPVYQCEYRLRHKSGHWVWVLDRGKVVQRDARGQPLRVVGTQTDITSRKEMEERLRHGEEMSLQLGRLAQIGAWEWDLSNSRLTWSPEMFRIHEVELGYEPTLAKSLEFYPLHAKNSLADALQHAVRAGTGFDLELPFTTARGHQLWVRVLGRAAIKDGHATRLYGAFQDITGRRDAEEMRRQLEGQLFQAQKMETLGTLAGGIAHDFNNLLTGILGYQDLALDGIVEGDPVRNYLGAARDASLRARELVDQILTFSRQSSSEKVPVNLGQLIEDARRFLRATVPATIRMEVDIAPDCGRVLADATQLHQVLLNLGSNAAHAMRTTGGTMYITLGRAELDGDQANALGHLEPGQYLKLAFRDTGHGIDPETRKRIFDPFFTTKEVGQGTGLGLSVVHGIIQAHAGGITVDSEVGHGATFTLYLPEAKADRVDEAAPDTSMPRGSGELIAVVDDEDIVRSFAQMALEKIGYRVAAFDSPMQCLEALRRQPGDFALLLTDQTMPGMKGIELAAEVRATAPRLPVVIMSGYFSRISPDKLAQIGQVALLSKPFTNDELARTIRRGLNPNGSGSPFIPSTQSRPPGFA